MNILTIDGGGIRGYFAAFLLQRIQKELGIDFSQYFDLVSGTSTGSIIAAALATKYPIEEVTKLYVERGRAIFDAKRFNFSGTLRAKYDNAVLKAEIMRAFGEKTLSETKTGLLIPSVDLVSGKVHVFKSNYLDEFVRDKDAAISDAVLASCSAPFYFQPHQANSFLFADGGIWANDPTLVAYVEAVGKLNRPPENVRIFSIGTGTGNRHYSNRDAGREWGAITGWRRTKFIELVLNLQTEAASNMVSLLPSGDYLRLNFSREHIPRLDDVRALDDLKANAEREFATRFDEIRRFCGA